MESGEYAKRKEVRNDTDLLFMFQEGRYANISKKGMKAAHLKVGEK